MSATADTVKPSAATERTGEPQLAGDVGAHDTSSATEHADPASGWEIPEVQSAEWQSVATEHDDILLTIDAATKIRRDFKGQPGRLHAEARQLLNEITENAGQDGFWDIDDFTRWKEYIAMHEQCQKIIGDGIISAYLEKIHNTRDPNRGNKERVDYIF